MNQQKQGKAMVFNSLEKKIPPKRTLACFLKTAVLPVGSTMYVFGGGWNEEDTGAGIEAVTLGLSKEWAAFAEKQDANYDHTKYRYWIHKGLDCSGYVGWVLYNTLETKNGQNGYVMSAARMAKEFAGRGWGTLFSWETGIVQPGDIVSMKDHVWISLGTCQDGSVLLVHASPPGISLCGTCLPSLRGEPEKKGQAVFLAKQYMKRYFSYWYERYPSCCRGSFYVTQSERMCWNKTMLSDPEGVQKMRPEEVLRYLFEKE